MAVRTSLNWFLISSSVPMAFAGSWKFWWNFFAFEGNIGHRAWALSQTVITKSKFKWAKSSTWLEVWCEMSMPSSNMVAIARGFNPWASTQALKTSALSTEKWRNTLLQSDLDNCCQCTEPIFSVWTSYKQPDKIDDTKLWIKPKQKLQYNYRCCNNDGLFEFFNECFHMPLDLSDSLLLMILKYFSNFLIAPSLTQ